MRYRRLTGNDYTFGSSQKDFLIDTPDAVGQAVVTSLKLWLGEWYLDTTLGVPYLQGVLGTYGKDQADATLQAAILAVTGVVNIYSYVSGVDTSDRAFSLTVGVNTIYGPTEVQIANYRIF